MRKKVPLIAKKEEREVKKVAKKLGVVISNDDGVPFILRIIALLMLIGGLSILGSTLSDLVRPAPTGLGIYYLRVLVGAMSIAVSYGLVTKSIWAPWLYVLIVFIGFSTNPELTVLPLVILVYIFIEGRYYKLFSEGGLVFKLSALLRKTFRKFR